MSKRFALVSLLLATWFGFATDASAAGPGEATRPAGASVVTPIEGDVTLLNQCLADNRSLSVLFLVDTSQSLKSTDPEAARVAGLQSAVSSLATLQSATTTTPIDVFVEFASFGSTTQRTFPDRPLWAPLVDDEELMSQLDARYRTNNESEDTDYVAALEPWANRTDPVRPADQVGAIELLEKAPTDSCRFLVWFTDGRFDIDYQGTPKTLHWAVPPIQVTSEADETAAKGLGADLLCRPQGLADRLRAADIANGSGAEVAVVALGAESDYELLRSIAQGRLQAGEGCGELPARGLFLGASDVPSLVLQLRSAVLGPDDGSASGPSGVETCDSASRSSGVPQDQVTDFEYPFELSSALTAFNLLVLPGNRSVQSVLVSPDGAEYPLSVSERTTLPSGVDLSVKSLALTSGGYQVGGTPPAESAGWTGQWRVRFCTDDPAAFDAVNRASIYVFGGLEPQLRGEAVEIRKGSEGSFVVELVSAAGLPATDVAVATDSTLEVSVDGEVLATPEPGDDGSFTYTYPVAEDTAVDEMAITATLTPVLHLADDAPTLTLPQWSGDLGTITLKPYPIEDVERSFEVGGDLVGFNVLALPADPGIETLLVSPDGSEYPLAVGESTTMDNGVTLSVDALGDVDGVQVNGVLPEDRADEWAGTWLVRFRSDASVEAAVVDDSATYLFGGVQPRLRGEAVEIRKGSEGSFVVELVSAAGLPATDVAVATDSTLEVSVDGEVLATPEPGDDGSFTYTYPVAEDTAVDEMAITATLTPVLHLADDAPTLTLPQWSGDLGTITLKPYPIEDVERSFEVGGDLVGFNVLALPADPGIETLLVSPDGSEYPLAVGESTTMDNGVTLSVDALGDVDGVQVNGVLPEDRADEWAGTWLVRFRSDASVEAAVVDDSATYLFGGVQPRLRGEAVEIRKGSEGSFVVELVSAAGLPATDVAVATDSTLEVSVDGEVLATPEPGDDGSFTYTYPVAEDTAVDEMAITATLTPVLHLADDAPTLTLPQWSGDLGTITLKPVPQFPLVETPVEVDRAVDQEHLVLETTIGIDATATASGGCVTLTKLVAPAGAATDQTLELSVFDGEHQVEVDDECAVRMADGERRELRVRLDASDLTIETPETFDGSLSFRSVSEIDPTKIDTFDDLTVSVRVNPIYVTHTEWLKVAGLVIFAVLLPLLLLIGANLYRARVDVGRVALVELPVLFTGGRLLRRTPDGATSELAIDDEDMRTARVPPAGRYRSVTTGPATFTGRFPLNPFADVYADVTAVDAGFVVGARGSTRGGGRGLLDGSLMPSSMDAWAFASSQLPVADGDAMAPIEGSLILLTHTVPEAATVALADIIPSIEDRIGRTARRLAVADEQALSDSDGQADHREMSETPASVNPLADDLPRSSADPFDLDLGPASAQANEETQRKPRRRLFGDRRRAPTPSVSSAERPTLRSVPMDAEEHGQPVYQGPPL